MAYLHPVEERPNLTIETHLQVHRVLFEGGRAVGVAGERLSEPIELRADREVILAAGAYNTPQLLMLSGLGPAELLEFLLIDVVLDQPLIGQNLQDHANCGAVYLTSKPVSLLLGVEPANQQLWMDEGGGPLSSNVAEVGGFVRSVDGLPAPDIQFHAAPGVFADEGLTPVAEHGFSSGACVLKPASAGTLVLASADPTAKPLIRHDYFARDEDMETMMRGVRMAMEMCRTEPLAQYCETPFAAPEDPDDDEGLRAFIGSCVQTLYHPTSTCAIGSVVDTELRVEGWTACGSSTPRSCRACRAATPTHRPRDRRACGGPHRGTRGARAGGAGGGRGGAAGRGLAPTGLLAPFLLLREPCPRPSPTSTAAPRAPR